MSEFRASALTPVGGHSGQCVVGASSEALSISTPGGGSVIGSWQYGHIRKFRSEPVERLFIFQSGSHGPFGVEEYQLELSRDDLSALQSIITAATGTQFGAKSQGHTLLGNAPSNNSADESGLESSLRNPTSPSLTNPQAALRRVKELAASYTPSQGEEGERTRRMNVYTELVKTEGDYVSNLKTVIDAYYDAMDPESVSIPLRLRGKRNVVFGNLQDIYKFHDRVFSEALGFFSHCPERVGDCFMLFAAEFELYAVYCKNRLKSEVLVNEGTECQAFFKGIQRNLGHALDLNAYLLTPVQRITKYQLLLKDLLKHSADMKNAVGELEAAYNKMCRILKELNDSMHTAGLTGLPDDLPEPGKLLAHDLFHVGVFESGPLTFSRSREKHVFLFEKVIILSKRTETIEGNSKRAKKTEAYIYKEHLDMMAVTLRESVEDHPLMFALSLHKQPKEYRFEAQKREVHEMWVSEIRRLLHLQFAMLKMQQEKATFTPPCRKKVIDTDLNGSRERVSSYPMLDLTAKTPSSTMSEKPPHLTHKLETGSGNKSLSPPPSSPAPSPPPDIKEPQPYEKTPYQRRLDNDQSRGHQKSSPPDCNSGAPRRNGQSGGQQKAKAQDSSSQDKRVLRPERKSVPAPTNAHHHGNERKRSNVVTGGLHVDKGVDEALREVRSKDLNPAWCVCGYHSNSELVVLGKGEGSVTELKKYFHDDIIAFGLLRVVEVVDEMARARLVYLEWVGVKSRIKDKASITTHRPLLEQLFQPYHADIFATSQADISERLIMDKVTNISGSKSHVV